MKCIVVKSDVIPDWWRIERAEHDRREWEEERREGGWTVIYHCLSCRLEPYACIEGTGTEMLDLAHAIETGQSESHKRCAAGWTPEGYLMESPRNSNGRSVLITHEEAKELAADIRAKIAGDGPQEGLQ